MDTRKSWKKCNYLNTEEFVPFGDHGDSCEIELVFGYDEAVSAAKGYNDSKPIAAFTVAGLGLFLPWKIENSYLCCSNDDGIWSIEYSCVGIYSNDCLIYKKEDVKEANARGKLLIYLLKQKIITVWLA